jgi:hypothetical protein
MPHADPPPDPLSDPLEDLKERIETFLLELQHPVLTEPGREVIDLSSSNYSLSTEYHKLLWHIWNEHINLVRQVTAIHKTNAKRMELRFQKFGKGPPGTLIIAESRAGKEQLERRGERSRYAQLLRRFLAQLFPQWKIADLTSEPDLQHSFSACYTRGMLSLGQRAWAVIGAGEQEDPHAVEGILTYGLIWLDWLRRRETGRVFEGLKIFVPPKRAATTLQRLAWMDPEIARWEVYETGEEILRRDPADVGNLKTSLPPAGGAFTLQPPGESAVERISKRIRALSPTIETHYGSDNFRVFAVHGLPFARETARGVVFGVGRAETLLADGNFSGLKRLVSQILRFRRPQSEAPLHPYFRLQPEKWMQSMVIRQIGILGYDLAPGALYEQVPAVSGSERGLMDLLAVNSQGRLAVVEFKASEDIHLPLQALDYWMRVHWHQQRGDLENLRYFPQRVLSAREPLLLLVSPALQFHPACQTVLRYFSPSVEVVRVGLNENWRDGLQVIFRMPR